MEYLTYSRESGFNIIDLDETDIDKIDPTLDFEVLDYVSEVYPEIIKIIRESIK